MTSRGKLESLDGDALGDAIEDETDVQSLLEFVKSRYCKEAVQYYEELTKGRELIYKPVPGYWDQEIALPSDVLPRDYFKEWSERTERWVGMKKRAVDRLLMLNPEAGASLLEYFCGLEVDLHLRRALVSKQTVYWDIVRRDIKKFAADKLGLSSNPIVRFFQELKYRRRIRRNDRVHPDFLARYQYYQEVRDMLRSGKR